MLTDACCRICCGVGGATVAVAVDPGWDERAPCLLLDPLLLLLLLLLVVLPSEEEEEDDDDDEEAALVDNSPSISERCTCSSTNFTMLGFSTI